MNDPSATVSTTVARCRVRMQLVAAARRAGITIPLAIVAVELFAVTSALSLAQLVAIAFGALGLAVAIAALPSILRVPSVRTSAAAIDTRLRLQDRTVTAVQMLDDADPMARLVVRDAAKRLSSVSPGRVFPFEAPSHFRSALAGALGATVLFVVMTAIRGQAGTPPNGSDGIRSAGAAQSGRMGKPPSNAQVAEGAAPSAVVAQPKASSPTPATHEETPIGRESAENNPAEQTLARSGSTPRAVDAARSAPARNAGAAAGARDSGRGATGFAERTAAAAGGVSGTIDPNPADATRRAARAAAPAGRGVPRPIPHRLRPGAERRRTRATPRTAADIRETLLRRHSPMTSIDTVQAQASAFRTTFDSLKAEIGRVFVGHSALVDHLLVCFFCQGHALIEGPPGLGKTLLVKTLSDAADLRFARVQCTPDLMPADVTGTNILVDTPGGQREFVFQRGPIFANIVLADEINRATPRTQAAFLEAMQERRVTVFGVTHPLDVPFSVFATQNPIEMEGTYPLPEAQLDRFFFKLNVPVPDVADMAEIMARTTGDLQTRVNRAVDLDTVRSMLGLIRQVRIADETMRLVLTLVRATHPDVENALPEVKQYVRYGASPRAAQAIILAAKAFALVDGRYHVAVEDVRRVAVPALNHRLILNFHGEMERITATSIVERVLTARGQA